MYVLTWFHVLTGMDDPAAHPHLAALTMVIGVAGALAQDDVKRILSFHIISQIGYMLMGLGLFTLLHRRRHRLVHYIPVKTVLFLVGGLIEEREGTSALDKIGGLASVSRCSLSTAAGQPRRHPAVLGLRRGQAVDAASRRSW